MVNPLDDASAAGSAYRYLVEHPRSTAEEVGAGTGVPTASVRDTLTHLAGAHAAVRLCTADGERWEAEPPDSVVSARLLAEERRLVELRTVGTELARVYRAAREVDRSDIGLEVVHEPGQAMAYYDQFQVLARSEIKALSGPPYIDRHAATEDAQAATQAERMTAGVRYRVIYDSRVLDDLARVDYLFKAVELGEQARILTDSPMKVLISDDTRALLPLDPAGTGRNVSLIVHPSDLLDALIRVFETLWRLAVPLTGTSPTNQIDDRDQAIVTLMAAGLTDDAIARRLRLSRRSVVRRTGALLERLGATTRFQAGVQAARRGWL
ncbi:MAG TPA: transcriptional regulator [Pseudonocardiaceae bacterium]|jgi:DNA-binding CsgD family transcriptional regulator/sugar-specific transcriptional regulator TrmB|nr:transcriptional regulator [Pseudonocardiaceae bacterium]